MSLASLHRKIFPVPSRLRWLRSRLDRNRLGVEIGPCHNAVAPKRDGWRVEIVDHLDQEGLREKYRGRDFDVGLIERVDHVWSGQALPDLVGAGRASWVVASHVAEHSPDLVRFLEGCLGLLEPGGKLVLALPDHRRCFDKKRSPSVPAVGLERADAWPGRDGGPGACGGCTTTPRRGASGRSPGPTASTTTPTSGASRPGPSWSFWRSCAPWGSCGADCTKAPSARATNSSWC